MAMLTQMHFLTQLSHETKLVGLNQKFFFYKYKPWQFYWNLSYVDELLT